MYKTRITKWGLDKKTKEREARAILRLHAQRRDKPTKMRLRGQPVDVNRIQTYFKRKGISVEDVLSPESNSNSDVDLFTDMDLVCRTPSPSVSLDDAAHASLTGVSVQEVPVETLARLPRGHFISNAIPPRIEAPGMLKMVEELFADIREFMMRLARTNQPLDSLLTSDLSSPPISNLGEEETSNFTPSNWLVIDTRLVLGILTICREGKFNRQAQQPMLCILAVLTYFWCRGPCPRTDPRHKLLQNGIMFTAKRAVVSTTPVFKRIIVRLLILSNSDDPFDLITMATMRVSFDSLSVFLGVDQKDKKSYLQTKEYIGSKRYFLHRFRSARLDRGIWILSASQRVPAMYEVGRVCRVLPHTIS